jgi:hypothetical protein
MNPDYEKESAAAVDRLLKDLPELDAPATLAPRVINAIRGRLAAPWYRRSWETWPAPLRAALVAALVAVFVGLCLVATNVGHAPGLVTARHRFQSCAADAAAAWHIVVALLNASVLAVKHLGPRFIVAALTAAALAYALCVGFGTACVKYAFARR